MTTDQIIIDDINVSEIGVVFYRQTTKTVGADNEVVNLYYRSSVAPGSDISSLPPEVQDACNAAWTPEVLSNFDSYLKSIAFTAQQ